MLKVRTEFNQSQQQQWPLASIYTDETIIADHNDVFNDNVSAYLAAIVAEGRARRSVNYSSIQDPRLPLACQSYEFDFGACLD